MKTKIIACYSIFIGVSVLGMWIMILSNGKIPEGKTEMAFHLFSEFLMAIVCIISGIMLLKKLKNAKLLNIAGFGMVIYSVLNAAGYYGEKGETPMIVMFVMLFALTILILVLQFVPDTEKRK